MRSGRALALVGVAVLLSCKQADSLLQVDVTADAPFPAGSNLVLSVEGLVSRTFSNVTLDEVFHAGLYVRPAGAGRVLSASIGDASCTRGRGEGVSLGSIGAGELVGPVAVVVKHLDGCEPVVDAGSDAPSGTGGRGEATGGASGATGTGAAPGSGGGSGSGGAGPGTGGGSPGTGGGSPGTGGTGTGGSAGASAGMSGMAGGGGLGGAGGRGGSGGVMIVVGSPLCGNGMLDPGEACDDGVRNGAFLGDGSGCSRTCTKEPKCRDGGATRACDPTCGDGFVEPGEDCDDGNRLAGDGCSPDCKVEGGFTCPPVTIPDAFPCTAGTTSPKCVRLGAIVRDFKSEKEPDGHPDFFYMGAPLPTPVSVTGVSGQSSPFVFDKRYCVPAADGPARSSDSVARIWDLAAPALGPQGKPVFNAARANGNLAPCQFTDWSHDTNGGRVPGYTITNSPLNGLVYVAGSQGHPLYLGPVPIVKDAASFAGWWVDGAHVAGFSHVIVPFDLTDDGSGRFQFATSPHNVYGGLFPLDPPANNFPLARASMSGPGTVTTIAATSEALVCNIWPYWFSSAAFGDGNGCRGDQYLFPPSVTPVAGMWVSALQGWRHDYWFTTELRTVFEFGGAFEIQVQADDDFFLFINGQLAIDLGGTHLPLGGWVQVAADGTATITEGGIPNPTTGALNTCPGTDPYTGLVTNATCAGGDCDCRVRKIPLGLEVGRTYELAIFQAERHPTTSGLALSVSGLSRRISACARTAP